MDRFKYWKKCEITKFKKYWKLYIEYKAGKRRELTRLEREKLASFAKWKREHKPEYEHRKQECGGVNDYEYEADPHHYDYPEDHPNYEVPAPYDHTKEYEPRVPYNGF